ncbi:DUF6158 family protein [Streptomyces sp. NPDC048751]|uniref:DUF6158 family protein n=1 Tax=Streptomyces sp. NPDC048751 TaxID=3365591 RepID=UPI0037120A7D
MNEHDERDIAMTGVDPDRLDDQQLMKELETIHRTRHDTLLHGSNDALRAHNERMAQLEGEYLRRNPRRFVAQGRTREGARERGREQHELVGKWGRGTGGQGATNGPGGK